MLESGSKMSTVPEVWASFGIFWRDPNDFLSLLVTTDETWLYHYDPETKQQSMEWGIAVYPAPKYPSEKFVGKILAWIFWDQDGILLMHYLPKGQTNKAQYCSSLLVQLNEILKEKRRGKFKKGALFLHDNAPVHRALASQKKLAYLSFQYLDHPAIIRFWPHRTTTCSLDWKNNFNDAIFFPTRRSLLPRRPGWKD